MDPAREKRKEEIHKVDLKIKKILVSFFCSSQDFLTQLVCNLLDEGNAFFRDGQFEQAVREFSEGLNVSCYAEAEEIKISEVFLESLYVNRAAAYHSMGEYEQGVLDCNSALEVCKDSRRALYKKALCLRELGKHKEAYDCTASYLLINPQDKQVNELAQELATHLGLKIRKPYVSAKVSKCVGIYTYVHKPDLVHNCKRDILLCRLKADPPAEWTRVRPLPNLRSFGGRFVLCRELLKSGDLGVCKYGEKCTFAYNQLEIDVWTEERKGKLDRNLLFGTKPVKLDPVSSIIRLLQEDKGTFVFLCQACYDGKPRIISKRCRDNQTICSNLDHTGRYESSKVRPLSVLCHMDLCRQAIRYGCMREDECHYAHSVIELKTWKVQQDTGVSFEEIVRISTNKPGGGGGAGKSLNMRMKFACGQCWLDGLISEPDKTLKYCGAKARHAWTKDRRVLLVKSSERSKWVQVRPLPHAKDFPAQYYVSLHFKTKKKCTYSGVCTFAHSPEEKDMWMYMKNNDCKLLKVPNAPIPEEKCITMPTDYAEPMSGFHCRLCGKHSNSERQWQQHISTEKHKDRVFSCEGDEALTWSYRFPGTRFELCPKLDCSCPDGVSCDYAHSPEELQEWLERRDFLRQKLAKAREDMLIMPEEVDFGKYNFLLQD
uniref:Zinc finger CCCH-type containing 7B n=1 Tax=Amphilophus citrinellus TaxID=61819 RepID=A0A3Q0RQS5_AMPCI